MAQIQRIRYSHDAMIDHLIENPWISQNELASIFGYSPAWVSTVMNSDAFRARLASRREQLVDPTIALSLQERFQAVAEQSLRVLQEKLSLPAPMVSDNLVLRAAELGAKALGQGGFSPAGPPVDPSQNLDRLAERLTGLLSNKKAITYDPAETVEFVEVSPSEVSA